MTTDEFKIKLKEIKSRYYREDIDFEWKLISTDRLFVEKLKTELEQLKSHEEIWDISSTEPFKYKTNTIEMWGVGFERNGFTVILSNSKKRELIITP